jgi:hypothetical protein
MQLECIASGDSNMHAMQCCYSTSYTGFTIHFMYSTQIRVDSNTVILQPPGKHVQPQTDGQEGHKNEQSLQIISQHNVSSVKTCKL